VRGDGAEPSPAAAAAPASTGPASTGPASTGPASTGPASTGPDSGAAASPVNGSAPQPEERQDQAGGEPGPAGA
jgi:excinuclease ABC subunit C